MKTLIVTASSKSKRDLTEHKFNYSHQTFTNSITSSFKKTLLDSRQNVMKNMGLDPGPDLLDVNIAESDDLFLPAYIRYAGRTYSKIDHDAWNVAVENPEKVDCVILSALYGLIRFNEPIRNYPIKQVDKIPNKSSIQNYWKNQGASDWLFDYVKKNDVNDVKFVLSTSYSGIISRDKLMERLQDELGVSSEDKQLKSKGMASMLERGRYINQFLLENK